MLTLNQTKNPKKFVVVTKHFEGLGFAKHLKEEGNEVLLAYRMGDSEDDYEKQDEYNIVGDGIVDKMELDDVMKNRSDYKDYYFIWDQNHNCEDADLLRSEGFKVLGGMGLQSKMEYDRKFGMELVKSAGMDVLPYFEFKTIEEGIDALLDNPEIAYVFKPDESDCAYTTYVPDNEDDGMANEELRKYMKALPEDGITYVLQERIRGLEFNVEIWINKGKPIFAFITIESKRKLNKDEGPMIGCAHDVTFIIPLDAKVLKETVYKLLPYIPSDYTGFLDNNIINKDKKNYFLEFCSRFGYNSHPNLLWNLAISPIGDIFADLIDGTNLDKFYDHFRYGFGASIRMLISHPKKGFPFEKEANLHGYFYHWDTYKEYNEDTGEEEYYLAGFSNQIGIICAHGFTIHEAAEECIRLGHKIHYPMHEMRTDLDKTDYPSNPQSAYDALIAMNYLEK